MADDEKLSVEELEHLQTDIYADLALLGGVQQRMALRLTDARVNPVLKVLLVASCIHAHNALNRAANGMLRWAAREAEPISVSDKVPASRPH